MKYGNNLELEYNQLVNPLLQNLASDPTPGAATKLGLIWFNTGAAKEAKVWDGAAVQILSNRLETVTGTGAISVGAVTAKNQAISIAAASGAALGTMSIADFNKLAALTPGATVNATDAALRDRALHTGTQLHSTISDFDVEVNALVASGITLKAPLASPTFTGTVSGVTATHVGLGSVNNTTDLAKPVSTATSTALGLKADLVGGLVPTSQLPSLSLNNSVAVASQAAMLALTSVQVQPGDLAIRSDGAGTFMLMAADPSVLGNWTLLESKTDAVTSVNGDTGTVVLAKADVGLSNVDNTADAAKPLSTADNTALALKANLASPAFTGTPTGITATHVGLNLVNNTADSAKPVSTAQATADGLRLLASNNLSDIPNDVTARTNIGAIGKYATDFGGLTANVITHNLGTTDVTVNVYEIATKTQIIVDIVHTSASVVTINFSVAPAAASHRVIVTG